MKTYRILEKTGSTILAIVLTFTVCATDLGAQRDSRVSLSPDQLGKPEIWIKVFDFETEKYDLVTVKDKAPYLGEVVSLASDVLVFKMPNKQFRNIKQDELLAIFFSVGRVGDIDPPPPTVEAGNDLIFLRSGGVKAAKVLGIQKDGIFTSSGNFERAKVYLILFQPQHPTGLVVAEEVPEPPDEGEDNTSPQGGKGLDPSQPGSMKSDACTGFCWSGKTTLQRDVTVGFDFNEEMVLNLVLREEKAFLGLINLVFERGEVSYRIEQRGGLVGHVEFARRLGPEDFLNPGWLTIGRYVQSLPRSERDHEMQEPFGPIGQTQFFLGLKHPGVQYIVREPTTPEDVSLLPVIYPNYGCDMPRMDKDLSRIQGQFGCGPVGEDRSNYSYDLTRLPCKDLKEQPHDVAGGPSTEKEQEPPEEEDCTYFSTVTEEWYENEMEQTFCKLKETFNEEFQGHIQGTLDNHEAWKSGMATCGIVKVVSTVLEAFLAEQGLIFEAALQLKGVIEKVSEGDPSWLIPDGSWAMAGFTVLTGLEDALQALTGGDAGLRNRLRSCSGTMTAGVYDASWDFLNHRAEVHRVAKKMGKLLSQLQQLDIERYFALQEQYRRCTACAEERGKDPRACPTPFMGSVVRGRLPACSTK